MTKMMFVSPGVNSALIVSVWGDRRVWWAFPDGKTFLA